MLVIYRPLLFASVDPELALARGVPTRLVGLLFVYVLALTVTEAAQIVGTLLVLSLAITPAAAASRLSARTPLVIATSVAFALIAADGGLLTGLDPPHREGQRLHHHDQLRHLRPGQGNLRAHREASYPPVRRRDDGARGTPPHTPVDEPGRTITSTVTATHSRLNTPVVIGSRPTPPPASSPAFGEDPIQRVDVEVGRRRRRCTAAAWSSGCSGGRRSAG